MQKKYENVEILYDWKKLINMKREEVVELHKIWLETNKENEVIRSRNSDFNQSKLNDIKKVLENNGIEIYKYKQKGFFKEKNGYVSWFKSNVYEKICKYENVSSYPYIHNCEKVIDEVRLYNNSSPTNLIEFYDRITMQYNCGIKKNNKENKLLIKSIEYAKENFIDIENLSTENIIKEVNDFAKNKFINDNFKYGENFYLNDNKCDCESWSYGEHRCSCGNRRCYLEVDGDIIDGFNFYVEVY